MANTLERFGAFVHRADFSLGGATSSEGLIFGGPIERATELDDVTHDGLGVTQAEDLRRLGP